MKSLVSLGSTGCGLQRAALNCQLLGRLPGLVREPVQSLPQGLGVVNFGSPRCVSLRTRKQSAVLALGLSDLSDVAGIVF